MTHVVVVKEEEEEEEDAVGRRKSINGIVSRRDAFPLACTASGSCLTASGTAVDSSVVHFLLLCNSEVLGMHLLHQRR